MTSITTETTSSRDPTIVVGVDDSPGAQAALAWAGRQARLTGSSLLAVHVFTYNEELGRDVMPGLLNTTWRQRATKDLRNVWTAGVDDTVTLRWRCIEAQSVGDGLHEAAVAASASLVVIGTERRHTLPNHTSPLRRLAAFGDVATVTIPPTPANAPGAAMVAAQS